ncbi:DUF2076 family protein [Mesorhizobium sp.]|uniref:DUF2076 domain-containing protein n=2 Tax=Mesorhizobium sp. TaxID=1871066 RepID=UPI00257D8C10|nr:DUF2076 family protein [Mesorhizobium sp.]
MNRDLENAPRKSLGTRRDWISELLPMDRNDQQAIATLFEKLGNVERQTPPRDPEAERFINDQIARQPGAPYYMAQTIIVQE